MHASLTSIRHVTLTLVLHLLVAPALARAADAALADASSAAPQQRGGRGEGAGTARIYKAQLAPHWFADNTRFWYRNDLRGGTKEFVLVDAEAGSRQPAFDHAKLATALSKAADAEYRADSLPFDSIDFTDDAKAVRFKVGDDAWKCD